MNIHPKSHRIIKSFLLHKVVLVFAKNSNRDQLTIVE